MLNKISFSSALASLLFSSSVLILFSANSIYADDFGNGSVVSGAKITDTVTGLPPGLGGVVLNNRQNLIYLTGYDWPNSIGNLLVLDGVTHKVINQISSATLNIDVIVDEETNTLWGFNGLTNTATQYDGRTLQALQTIPITVGINNVAYNKHTHKFYVTNGSGGITVFDRHLNQLKDLSCTPQNTSNCDDNANVIAINERTNRIYVTNYWDVTVTVIDGYTDNIIGNPISVGTAIAPNDCYTLGYGTNPLQPYPYCNNYDSFGATDGIAVDPVSNRIFAADVNTGAFVTIDGETNKVISTLQLPEGTFAPATLPGLNTALVVNWDRSTLSVVNEKTHKLTDTVPVGAPDSPDCLRIQWDGGSCSYWGDLPSGITVSNDNQKIFVLDTGDLQGNSPATDPHTNSKLVILKPTFSDRWKH